MPNNEEQHKTWTMLKKALKIEAFTSDIIPPFTTWTHTDKYGTWRCEQGGNPYRGNAVWALGTKNKTQLNLTNKNLIESFTTKASPNNVWVILNLPQGTSICPYEVSASYKYVSWAYLYGLNSDTGNWESLGGINQVISKDTFYSAFKWEFAPRSSSNTGMIGNIQIRSGKIRYK